MPRVAGPVPRLVALVALGLLLGPSARADGPADAPAPPQALGEGVSERWYEIAHQGNKSGWSCVTWAPSTWEGRKTIHDTTRTLSRSVRNMAGYKNVFETSSTLDIERGPDGTLYSLRSVSTEGERQTTSDLRWTGTSYVSRLQIGDGPVQELEIPLARPVTLDAESFLSERARGGALAPGATLQYSILDRRARAARVQEVRVVARETIDGHAGPVACLKVVDRDPETGSETTLWLDGEGAFVRIADDAGLVYQRVTRAKAEEMPVEPAEFTITTPSSPPLERVFSADLHEVELHLQGDPNRKLPELPTSPWSRVLSVAGDDDQGWVLRAELRAYDHPGLAPLALPVPREGPQGDFRRELESTPLMPCDHPRLKEVAARVVGDAADARTAAYRLARYVHDSLQKESPEIGSTTALEILDEQRGDCSEHCVLFVTLCRAAGIPARRCEGYVNIGNAWGVHAWAEIWLGDWVGADPTTGEVGTAARYLFFGYQDQPGSYPAVVSDRVLGRLRIVSTALVEDGVRVDLSDPARHRQHDRAAGRYRHLLAGIEVEGAPPEWSVRLVGSNYAFVQAPGLEATLRVMADQGDDLSAFGGANATFAGAPAFHQGYANRAVYWIHSRRRLIQLSLRDTSEETQALLARCLRRTFSASYAEPTPAHEAPEASPGDTLQPGEARVAPLPE